MHLQEADNAFRNFTIKYRNITSGKDQPRVDEFRTESIFRVAFAFVKFAFSYASTILVERGVRIMCEYERDRRFRSIKQLID